MNLTYLGAFRVPRGDQFAYGGQALAFNPANASLFITGLDQSEQIAEINPPATLIKATSSNISTLPLATIRQNMARLKVQSQGNLVGNVKVGGLFVYDNQLYVSRYEFYDAEGDARHSHCVYPGTSLADTAKGMFELTSPGAAWVGGYMGKITPQYQPLFANLPCFTGLGVVSIISRTSSGPAAFAFDPKTLGSSPAPTLAMVGYSLQHPLADPDVANELYTRADQVRGAVMLDDELVCFGIHGFGKPWYGENGDGSGNNDPSDSGKGEHAYPYRGQAWIYKVTDLAEVSAGRKQMWEIKPTIRVMSEFVGSNRYGGGAAFDPATGRLYVANLHAEQFGYPIIHVYQVGTIIAPPDTTKPIITDVTIFGYSAGTIGIKWKTNEPSDSRVEYSKGEFPGTITTDRTLVTDHSVVLQNLEPNTEYNLRVKSWDAAGNSSTSATFRQKTLPIETPVDPCQSVKDELAAVKAELVTVKGQLQVSAADVLNLHARIQELENYVSIDQQTIAALRSTIEQMKLDNVTLSTKIEKAKIALG